MGSAVSYTSGVWDGALVKLNLVHFSLRIWHLVGTNFNISLRVKPPNFKFGVAEHWQLGVWFQKLRVLECKISLVSGMGAGVLCLYQRIQQCTVRSESGWNRDEIIMHGLFGGPWGVGPWAQARRTRWIRRPCVWHDQSEPFSSLDDVTTLDQAGGQCGHCDSRSSLASTSLSVFRGRRCTLWTQF